MSIDVTYPPRMTRTIPAGEFKQTCLRLLEEVRSSGTPIVITKHGRAIAQLAPLEPSQMQTLWPTSLASSAEIRGDLVAPSTDPSEWEVLAD